jgi:hypothetical protein
MPLYAGFLALFYSPSISDDQFFVIAKKWNIYLSLALLAILGVVLSRFLPPLPATNLLLIVAFGYFVFKAGYAVRIAVYCLFFLAFVLLLGVIGRNSGTAGLFWRAGAAGAMAALAHLTKAAMLPLMAIGLAACAIDALLSIRTSRHALVKKLVAAAVVAAAFLVVLSPYLRTNKRVFGRYFYNVNTTFYMWYDDWPRASVGTILHGDGIGWPTLPADQLPGAARYWREHTIAQIASRIAAGFGDMVTRSCATCWYSITWCAIWCLGRLGVETLEGVCDADSRTPGDRRVSPDCALVYSFGIAFYAPVSGTGTTRFLIAHLLPLLFVLSLLFTREPFWHGMGVGRCEPSDHALSPADQRHARLRPALRHLAAPDDHVWRILTTKTTKALRRARRSV